MTYSLPSDYSEAETEFAFEGEAIGFNELFGESSFTEADDLDDEVFGESYVSGSNDDEIFGSAEDSGNDFDDDLPLSRITREINRDVEGMNESEAESYMQERMGEFFPALAAAIPSIISIAPTAISAVKSLFSKGSPTTPPAPGTPQLTPPPQVVPPLQLQTTAPPGPTPVTPVNTNVTGTGGTAPQLLTSLLALIQQPDILQMLTNMISGTGQTVTGGNGQQVNGSNILAVISSLAGTLAGNAGGGSRESSFPEYAVSSEGTFVIDPHESIEEAELILEILK